MSPVFDLFMAGKILAAGEFTANAGCIWGCWVYWISLPMGGSVRSCR
jgi:hypothetical protein